MASGAVTGFDPSSNGTFATNTSTQGVSFDISGTATYTLTQAKNDTANKLKTEAFTGAQYVFEATGGYTNSQTFEDITVLTQKQITKYDVTGAVEVKFPASVLNDKINVGSTTVSWWNDTNMSFVQDSLSVTGAEFVAQVNAADKVISVGKLSTLYSDFSRYVLTYFGYTSTANKVDLGTAGTSGAGKVNASANDYGFSTLFSNEYSFNPNNGIFGPEDFINIINGTVESANQVDGSYNSALSGQIDVSNITQLLRDAVSANPFGNRDLTDSTNGVSAGFLADDLIFVREDGIKITLELIVDKSAFAGNNDMLNTKAANYTTNYTASDAANNAYFGDKTVGGLDAFRDVSSNVTGTVGSEGVSFTNTTAFKSNTSSTSTLIKREMSAPLLLKLT